MSGTFEFNSNERFYEDNFNEDDPIERDDDYYELEDEEEKEELGEKETESDDDEETRAHLSFACDDCDYRWDDVIVGNKDKIEREEFDLACPMCGSVSITQI